MASPQRTSRQQAHTLTSPPRPAPFDTPRTQQLDAITRIESYRHPPTSDRQPVIPRTARRPRHGRHPLPCQRGTHRRLACMVEPRPHTAGIARSDVVGEAPSLRIRGRLPTRQAAPRHGVAKHFRRVRKGIPGRIDQTTFHIAWSPVRPAPNFQGLIQTSGLFRRQAVPGDRSSDRRIDTVSDCHVPFPRRPGRR